MNNVNTRISNPSVIGAEPLRPLVTMIVTLKRWFPRLIAGVFFAHASIGVHAAPGDLDTTFGVAGNPPGTVATAMSTSATNDDYVQKVLALPDGKILAVGWCTSTTVGLTEFCIARYNSDGQIDTTYGPTSSGIVRTTFVAASTNKAYGAALQPDGKLVVVGGCSTNQFCVARYTSSGSPDNTFSVATNGKAFTLMGTGAARALDVAVQGDGKLVVLGECENAGVNSFCLTRFLSDGTSLDSTFGSGTGKVIVTVSTVVSPLVPRDYPTALTLQSDGKIIAVGDCWDGTKQRFCVARFNVDGSFDNTFSTNGRVNTSIGTADDLAKSVAIQGDGRIVVGGSCYNTAANSYDFCVVRYNLAGNLHAAFGVAGRVLQSVSAGDIDRGGYITLQPDGKILQTGECRTGAFQFCAVRYQDSGQLDTSFGTDGKVFTTIGIDDAKSTTISQQYDGKILMGGSCSSVVGTTINFCVARYIGGPFSNQNCSLDLDGDNIVTQNVDAVIAARFALGFRNAAVVAGLTFSTTATRKTWPAIRDFLISQCGLNFAP
jgi:uncharacterized delta-60 repeat protein